MRSRISIRDFVCPSVGWSVGLSVGWSVGLSVTQMLNSWNQRLYRCDKAPLKWLCLLVGLSVCRVHTSHLIGLLGLVHKCSIILSYMGSFIHSFIHKRRSLTGDVSLVSGPYMYTENTHLPLCQSCPLGIEWVGRPRRRGSCWSAGRPVCASCSSSSTRRGSSRTDWPSPMTRRTCGWDHRLSCERCSSSIFPLGCF